MSVSQKVKTAVFNNKPRLIIFIAVFVAVALLMTRPQEARSLAAEKAWRVVTLPVSAGSLSPALELFGSVLSPQDAQLSAALDAEVMKLKVLDGAQVAKGDVLVELDGRDAQLTLAERQAEVKEIDASVRLTKRRLSRNRLALLGEQELLAITLSQATRAADLFADQLISAADVETTSENLKRQQLAVNQSKLTVEENQLAIEQQQAQMARARAQRDRAQLDVERSVIRAPFPGVISDLNVSIGDRVRAGDELMRLQNPDAIEIRAQIPSRYAESVSLGLNSGATIAARINIDGRLLNGEVARVSGQTREGSGGVDSFIRLTESELGLRLGATVRVLLDLPEVDGVIGIPAEALYGRDRLYRISDGRMEMVAIERVGERIRADGKTEIIVRSELLSDGDEIIVTKLSNAVDGLLVEAAYIEPTAMVEAPAPSATKQLAKELQKVTKANNNGG
jgi:HlyD family secretion protein